MKPYSFAILACSASKLDVRAELAKAIASRVKQVREHQAQQSLFGGTPT